MQETYRYLIVTIDPVHVGTGGMRLGRVDNTIVREPGTKLPKIPGTALHGAIRAYSARRFGKIQCAGQSGHCGKLTCPICYTFGSISGQKSYSGVVSITDARILLFPVYSMVGPVWVTSPTVLNDAGFGDNNNVSDDKAKWQGLTDGNALNLGWLMLEKENNWTAPDNLKKSIPEAIKDRIVLVSDKLFSQIVNSNLEVRTSVSINPETGAAEEGALYSYEAIPRATIMWFDVIVDDFRKEFPSSQKLVEWGNTLKDKDKSKSLLEKWHLIDDKDNAEKIEQAKTKALGWINEDREKWNTMKSVTQTPSGIVKAGIEWLLHLGLGGMGTRGFGRVKEIACLKLNQDGTLDGKCSKNESHGGTESAEGGRDG